MTNDQLALAIEINAEARDLALNPAPEDVAILRVFCNDAPPGENFVFYAEMTRSGKNRTWFGYPDKECPPAWVDLAGVIENQ